jgi:glucuronoarabinoxylan endo-1,4-beta-xylanase
MPFHFIAFELSGRSRLIEAQQRHQAMKNLPMQYLPRVLSSRMAVKKAGHKNQWLRAPGAFVIGLLLQAGIAGAQNLVNNPGFESGAASPWSPFGSVTLTVETSQVHSGTYACQVGNRTATWNGVVQSFSGALQAGQTYNVSAWLRLVSGGNQTMQLTMQKTDGSGTSYAAMASGSVSSTAWTQLSGQYTYNPSGSVSALNFYAEMPSSSNTSYYIDDVVLSNTVQTVVTNSSTNGISIVDWNNVHQRIDGFGASSAYNVNGTWSTAEADLLFSTNNNISYQSVTYNGIGLSLLRNHIVPAGSSSASDAPTTAETSNMQLAQARGARVWSATWSPAAGFKSVHDIYDTNTATGGGINGGSFLGGDATNQAYASQVANYVANMKNTYGVNLYAISIQNEPDANVTSYDACQWSNTYIHDFVTNLFNALAAKGVGSTKIILPESQNWQDYHNLAGPAMTDPNVAADVSIIADHNYDGANGPSSLVKNNYGKALWETEVSQLGGETSDIVNGVYYAQRVYLFLTQAQANAWHYWWIVPSGSETGLMTQSAGTTKRMFTIGQYSRFVRPNNYRIDATSSQSSVLVSAYKDTNSSAFAIVVVNTNPSTDVSQTFNLNNFTAASVTPWITSASLSLAPQTLVTVTNGSFTYTIPAMSVVTFVGVGTTGPVNPPPSLAPVADQTINVGQTLLVTNAATDAAVPPNTLTFSLLNNPAGASLTSLDPTNALFTWRAPVSQANTTNPVTVAVTDNTTSLSATNTFKVIVNAITNPVTGSLNLAPGQVSLTVNGPQGPDYTFWTSTDLVNWQLMFTTNSPAIPFTITDTNATDPERFYKIQIGP